MLKSESYQVEADAEQKDSLNSMETWLKSESVQLEADGEQNDQLKDKEKCLSQKVSK